MNSILSFFSTIIKPVGDVIDALHTSDEERLTLKQKFFEHNEGSITKRAKK